MKQILLMIAVVALVGCGTTDLNNFIIEKAVRESLTAAGEEDLRADMPLAPGQSLPEPTTGEPNGFEGNLTKAHYEKITTLDIGRDRFGYGLALTSVKGLEKLTQLKRLALSHNELTSVKGLEKLTQLTQLTLFNNKLTSVKGLEKLTKLEELSLGWNQLTSVKGLEKLTELKELNLTRNPDLTEAQIDELKKALPKCRIVWP